MKTKALLVALILAISTLVGCNNTTITFDQVRLTAQIAGGAAGVAVKNIEQLKQYEPVISIAVQALTEAANAATDYTKLPDVSVLVVRQAIATYEAKTGKTLPTFVADMADPVVRAGIGQIVIVLQSYEAKNPLVKVTKEQIATVVKDFITAYLTNFPGK